MRRVAPLFALCLLGLLPACSELERRSEQIVKDHHVDEADLARLAALSKVLIEGDGYRARLMKDDGNAVERLLKLPRPTFWTAYGQREYQEQSSVPSPNLILRMLGWQSKKTTYHRDSVYVEITPQGSGARIIAGGKAQESSVTAQADSSWKEVYSVPLHDWSDAFPGRLRAVLEAAAVHQKAPLAR